MMNIIIYCEGTTGSHDRDILEKILDNLPSIPTIEPLGGKRGAGGYISIHKNKVQNVDSYIFFRDNDFDYEENRKCDETNEEKLHIIEKKNPDGSLAGKWLISYRTTIENYLINPKHFFEYLILNKKCTELNLNSEHEVKALFDKVAKEISAYQAIRHTLGKLRKNLDLGTTWRKGSGDLPEQLDLEFCKIKALEKIREKRQEADEWSDEVFYKTLEPFLQRFNTSEFYIKMEYLIWFQGKDFTKHLRTILCQSEKFILEYYKYAKSQINFIDFPDLRQLRDEVENRINS